MRSRHQRCTVVALSAAVLALAVACGGGDDTGTRSDGSAGAAAAGVLRAEDTSLGTILVDQQGMTVYVFANDTADSSTCTGSCASNWPPVEPPRASPTSAPDVTVELGAIRRDDGSRQLTVANHPLYTFVGDTARGQTNGHGRTLDGGLWSAVSPDGAPVAGSRGGSPSRSPDDRGGYGY